ncbi:hypothetical protein D9M71_78100 [compost metagenome]
MPAHDAFIVAFDHDAHQRLCTGLAQQHPPATAHGRGHALASLLDRRVLDRVDTTAEPDIDQHLRALVQAMTGLGKGLATALDGHQYLQCRNDGVTGRGVLQAKDMARVLPANLPITLQQLGRYVTVANLGAHKRNRQLVQGQLQAQVTHQGTHHAALQLATLMQVASDNEQQLVAIDNGAGVIDHQHPVAVAIKGDAQVGMPDQHRSLQGLDMGRTAFFVDVQAIGLSRQYGDIGTQFAEHAGRNFVGRTMGAVDDHLQAGKIGTGRHTALAEFDIAAGCIIDTRDLAELARLDHRHWRIEQFLDHQLDFIRQFGALAGKELDAIIVMGVVRCTDDDARIGMKGSGQIGNCRRGHRPQQHHIGASGGKAGLQRGFEHVARDARVLADQHLAGAQTTKGHAGGPTELEHEIRCNRVLANTTANAVSTKVFSAHKCSIILFG